MIEIDILIVEDKDEEIVKWGEAIQQFNMFSRKQGSEVRFEAQFSKSYKDAKIKLRTFNFSTAIIDIRLKDENDDSNEENTDGNRVLIDIVNSTMCLAFVYTGQQIDAEIPEHLKDYIEVIDRSAKSKSDLLGMLNSKLDILRSIIDLKGIFSESKAQHFYSSVWPRWSLWSQDASSNRNKAITRHMATHLHASFLNETDRVHPEEYYFTGPMIREKLDTGDIALVDGKHLVLVTPRCEIAQCKNNFYQFVELEDKSTEMANFLKELTILKDRKEEENLKLKDIRKSMKQKEVCLRGAEKNTNKQKSIVKKVISKFENAKENAEQLRLELVDEVDKLLELESEERTARSELSKKEIEQINAEKEFKKAEKAVQRKDEDIKKLLPSSGGKISLHILPEVKQLGSITYGPLHAHFEKLTYIPVTDIEAVENFKSGKYARLSNEFIPSFVERLGSHFSRIGTPDYSHPE
jgi:hypothetical protein